MRRAECPPTNPRAADPFYQKTTVVVLLKLLEAANSLEDEYRADVVLVNHRLRVKRFVEVFELYEGVLNVCNSTDMFPGHTYAAKAILLTGILHNVDIFTDKKEHSKPHFYKALHYAPGFANDYSAMTTWRKHKHLF